VVRRTFWLIKVVPTWKESLRNAVLGWTLYHCIILKEVTSGCQQPYVVCLWCRVIIRHYVTSWVETVVKNDLGTRKCFFISLFVRTASILRTGEWVFDYRCEQTVSFSPLALGPCHPVVSGGSRALHLWLPWGLRGLAILWFLGVPGHRHSVVTGGSGALPSGGCNGLCTRLLGGWYLAIVSDLVLVPAVRIREVVPSLPPYILLVRCLSKHSNMLIICSLTFT
jgi:hypothetical protein